MTLQTATPKSYRLARLLLRGRAWEWYLARLHKTEKRWNRPIDDHGPKVFPADTPPGNPRAMARPDPSCNGRHDSLDEQGQCRSCMADPSIRRNWEDAHAKRAFLYSTFTPEEWVKTFPKAAAKAPKATPKVERSVPQGVKSISNGEYTITYGDGTKLTHMHDEFQAAMDELGANLRLRPEERRSVEDILTPYIEADALTEGDIRIIMDHWNRQMARGLQVPAAIMAGVGWHNENSKPKVAYVPPTVQIPIPGERGLYWGTGSRGPF